MPSEGQNFQRSRHQEEQDAPAQTQTDFATRMAVFYGALFLIYGVHLPFFPPWLESRGLGLKEISLVIAVPMFLRVILTPAFAHYADTNGNHRLCIKSMAGLALFSALVLSQLTSFTAIAIGSLILAVSYSTIMPLTETIALTGVRTSSIDYGRMRLWGSATFILASFSGGVFVDIFGPAAGIWLLTSALAVTLAASWVIPQPYPQGQKTNCHALEHVRQKFARFCARNMRQVKSLERVTSSIKTDRALGPNQFKPDTAPPIKKSDTVTTSLLRDRLFILFLICAGLSQASHATYYAFATLTWLKQGMSPITVGALWGVGVTAEIALFSFSNTLVEKTGAVALLILGALAGAVRWTAMTFDPPLAALFPLQILHAFTYGATHIGAVHFIARAVPVKRTATAQAYYGTIGNGAALSAGILVSGWLIATWGPQTYFVMAAMSLVATVAGIALARSPNQVCKV